MARDYGNSKFCGRDHAPSVDACAACAKCKDALSTSWRRAKNDFLRWLGAPVLDLTTALEHSPDLLPAAEKGTSAFIRYIAEIVLSEADQAELVILEDG